MAQWTTLFSSSEAGYITFSANTFGALQLGAAFDMPTLCPTSDFVLRLVINGGDWIIETEISGLSTEMDDSTVSTYATKNGVFTAVPEAPGANLSLPVTFDQFISAINRPSGLVTGNPIVDPNDDSSLVVPDIYSQNDDYYVIKGIVPTLSNYTTPTLDDLATINSLRRYPTQTEIDFYEANYTAILQALNISPKLHVVESTIYVGEPHNVELTFRMYDDSQLKDALLGNKPFPGMKIYTTSLVLELTRQTLVGINMPYFVNTNNPLYDAHVVRFGMKADWGFAPIAQLS
jgi:hypothetical protein